MFKKKIAVTLAAAAMTLSASSAFAAFADLELIRVYYDRSGMEYATDLGKVTDFTAAGSVKNVAGTFGGLTTGYAVYFALDRTNFDLWATGSTATASTTNGSLTGINNGTNVMYTKYNTQGGTTYSGLASDASSYKNKLSATQGTLAAAISNASRLSTEISIASLLSTHTGSVTQALYFWDKANSTVATDKIGALAATIVTNADGSSTITSAAAAPTPIPPAFLLMGSGLLGMVGLRRKANKA